MAMTKASRLESCCPSSRAPIIPSMVTTKLRWWSSKRISATVSGSGLWTCRQWLKAREESQQRRSYLLGMSSSKWIARGGQKRFSWTTEYTHPEELLKRRSTPKNRSVFHAFPLNMLWFPKHFRESSTKPPSETQGSRGVFMFLFLPIESKGLFKMFQG